MINEKKLIEEITTFGKRMTNNGMQGDFHIKIIKAIIDIIANQAKVGEWIPCSERLPEKRDWYLAMFKEKDTNFMGLPVIADYLMGSHTAYTTKEGWIIANCTDREDGSAEYYKGLICVAWMPLPVPYKEDMRGEKHDC